MSTQATATEAIRRSVTVDCSVEQAFETFTERIHEWWPLGKHSIEQYESGNPAATVVFQGGAGGQVYERTTKGEELKWAGRGRLRPAAPLRARVAPEPRAGRAADRDRGHVHRRRAARRSSSSSTAAGRRSAPRPRRRGRATARAGMSVLGGFAERASS